MRPFNASTAYNVPSGANAMSAYPGRPSSPHVGGLAWIASVALLVEIIDGANGCGDDLWCACATAVRLIPTAIATAMVIHLRIKCSPLQVLGIRASVQ